MTFAYRSAFRSRTCSLATKGEHIVVNQTYKYTDEKGTLLFTKYRVEPGREGKKKDFYYEHIDKNGNAVKSLDGCHRVLYRLPELIKAIDKGQTIYLVEGEKDADNLSKNSIPATTALGSLEWNDEYTETLKNADVAILFDMDKTGHKRRDLLCKKLFGKVKRLRVVDLPGLEYRDSHGDDISDWLKHNALSKLLNITKETADYSPPPQEEETINDCIDNETAPQPIALENEASNNVPNQASFNDSLIQTKKIRAIPLEAFLQLKLPEREMLLAPFLPKQGLVLLYAKRGVGKTHIALGIAYAIASGGSFLKWHAPVPKKVLYIDGEMPANSMQERLRKLDNANDRKAEHSFLYIITPDLYEGIMPDLSTKEGRAQIEEIVKDFDLIIIDNISSLFRSGVENEAESWQPAQDWALQLRRQGKSVLFVHHAGKSGQQRGSSKKEDILDTVISLKQEDDYNPEEGASFEIHFEKARHFFGNDAAPFCVKLVEKEDRSEWQISLSAKDKEIFEIAELMNQGMKIHEMIQETNLTKSQIETRMKKAKHAGLVKR